MNGEILPTDKRPIQLPDGRVVTIPRDATPTEERMVITQLSHPDTMNTDRWHPLLNPETYAKLGAFAKTAALPTAGYALGGPGAAMLMALLNQRLGITKDNPMEVAAQALPPVLSRIPGLVSRVPGAIGRMWPGAEVAAHSEAASQAGQFASKFAPAENVSDLYRIVEQFHGLRIKVPNFTREAEKLAATESKALPGLKNATIRQVSEAGKKLGQIPEGAPFDQIQTNLQRLGESIKGAKGPELGAFKDLRLALHKDLEEAAAS